MTRIEWTEQTWNPVIGCRRVSPGCQHCYAERMAVRLAANPSLPYCVVVDRDRGGWNGDYHLVQPILARPYSWRAPRMVFVCSMSDLFSESVRSYAIGDVFEVMNQTPHTYQVLTKNPRRMYDLVHAGRIRFTDNIWAGVSVENSDYTDRIDLVKDTPARVRFVSFEPLLGPIVTDLTGLDWVIVGGESGPGARRMDLTWMREIRDQCRAAGVPVFIKQLGTAWSRANGLGGGKGSDPATWPGDLQSREMPNERT